MTFWILEAVNIKKFDIMAKFSIEIKAIFGETAKFALKRIQNKKKKAPL
jgi:hypothetical protein